MAVREYLEIRLLPIIDQWREHRRLFNAKSSNLLFMDLETSWGTPPGQDHSLIFQICIWDAAKHEIVYAKISQAMSVETLYNLKADAQWQAQVREWYGPPSDKETEGMSLLELACILEENGINENIFMIEQSIAFCNHDNLYKNLRRIGKQYLVPRRQNVLRLIKAFRIALQDFKINRGLGSMHHILFPQDTELIRYAHTSRADVEMTYKQAGVYFAGTEERDPPPGIQTYFKKGRTSG